MQFILFFHGGMPSDEEREVHNKEWGAWIGELSKDGVFKMGHPYGEGGKSVTAGSVEEYTSNAQEAGGYMVVEVDSMEAAVEVAQAAPHMKLGGTTVVRPLMEM